jgi:hypothetical protein
MGCDGGTIPKRNELVKTKKKKATLSKDVKNAARWNNCRLSQRPLEKPIICDTNGYLYNKEAIIEFLLDKSKYEKGPEHIRSLKDVKELNLVSNPSFNINKQENSGEQSEMNRSQWICPITGLEMNGSFKFFALFNCGCVFSERAYKTIQSSTKLNCLKCEKAFEPTDMIILNPTCPEDLELNVTKFETRKESAAKVKAEKQAAKVVLPKIAVDETVENLLPKTSKRSIDSSNGASCSKASAVTAGSMAKKIKSVQDDPNASSVYKNLFTSCDKAKNQQKAHWVTFNPQYF